MGMEILTAHGIKLPASLQAEWNSLKAARVKFLAECEKSKTSPIDADAGPEVEAQAADDADNDAEVVECAFDLRPNRARKAPKRRGPMTMD